MDKRKLTRVDFSINAIIVLGEKTIIGQVENLSMKGAYIGTSEKIDINSEVEVKIELAGNSSELQLYLKGAVTRIDETGFVLAFKNIDLDSFIHLKNIIEYNSGNMNEILKEYVSSIGE